MEDKQKETLITVGDLVHVIADGWEKTIKHLKEKYDLKNLKQEVLNTVSVEFMIFYLNYLNSILKRNMFDKEPDDLLKTMEDEIRKHMVARDKYSILKNWQNEEFIAREGLVVQYNRLLGKRFLEYSSYKYICPIEIGGFPVEESKNNALSVFSPRIAGLVKNDPEDSFKVTVSMITMRQVDDFKRWLAEKGIFIDTNYKN